MSDIGGGARLPTKMPECDCILNQGENSPLRICTARCTDGEPGALVHTPHETVDPNFEMGGPKRGTVRRGKAGSTLPLPGILDHRNFRRSKCSLGHCDLCGDKAAVYHSDKERVSVCEGCYARLVREWNWGEGVK